MGGLRLLPTPTRRAWTRPWHSMRRTTEAGPSFAQMPQSSPTRARARGKTARMARIRARKARRAKKERHLQRRSQRALVPWLSQLERRQHLPILILSERIKAGKPGLLPICPAHTKWSIVAKIVAKVDASQSI